MKIVILVGFCRNPGGLSRHESEKSGNASVFDRTPLDAADRLPRIADGNLRAFAEGYSIHAVG